MSKRTSKNLSLLSSRIHELVGPESLSGDQRKELDKGLRKLKEGVEREDRRILNEAIARIARALLKR